MRHLLSLVFILCHVLGTLFAGSATANVPASAHVRPLLDRDLPEIAELDFLTASRTGEPVWDIRRFKHESGPGAKSVLVVEQDHKVTGVLVFQAVDSGYEVVRSAFAPGTDGDAGMAETIRYLRDQLPTKALPKVELSFPYSATGALKMFSDGGFQVSDLGEDRIYLLHDHTHAWRLSPSELRQQDFYRRLGISENSSRAEVRRAYTKRKQANQDNPAVINLLSEAFTTLNSPLQRRKYNEEIARFPGLSGTGNFPVPESVPPPLGLSPKPLSPNLYERLGVGENSHPKVVSEAYEAAKRTAQTEQERTHIDQAFWVLGNSTLRAEYDSAQGMRSKSEKELARQRLIERGKKLREAPPAGDLPSTQELDVYARLGVSRQATQKQIQDAFHKALQTTKNNREQKHLVMQAYQVLRDPELRQFYDDRWPNLTARGRFELIERIWSEPEAVKEEHRTEMDNLDQPIPPERQRGSSQLDLYARLGVAADASNETIRTAHDRLALRAQNSLATLADLAEARDILTNPTARAHYNALREVLGQQERTTEIKNDLRSMAALARLDTRLQSPSASGSLPQFLEATRGEARHLSQAFGLARKYLRALDDKLTVAKTPLELEVAQELLQVLEIVRNNIPQDKFLEDIHLTELGIRQRLIGGYVNSPEVPRTTIDALLGYYLERRPPDFLSAALRQKRDTLSADGCVAKFQVLQ